MSSVKKATASDSHKPSTRKARDRRTDNPPSRRRHSRLRCPFHAKFPDKFRGYNSSCQGTGFETNARVVEHLKRTHGPIKLSDGISDANPEVRQSPSQPSADDEMERVTNEQLTSISELPRNSNIEEKWDMIYKIIFPGEVDVKPAYMPSLERLRDHARNPPEWLLANMTGSIGASREEILSMMQNFLVFFDIIGGNSPSLSTSILQPRPHGGSEVVAEHSSVDDMNDKSEAGSEDSHEGDSLKNNDIATQSHSHDSLTGASSADSL